MSYYGSGGGGYPGGYPGQQPPGGGGMPQPYGGAVPPAGGLPYPAQPPQIGFGGAAPPGGVAMPMPGDSGGPATYNAPYPAQGGYPQAQPGYPAQQPGYPAQQPGYPAQQPGYPSQQPPYGGGYPGAGQPPAAQGGYPGAGQPPTGYPAAAPQSGGYHASTQPSAQPGASSLAQGQGQAGGVYPVVPTAPDHGGKKSKAVSAPTDAMSKLAVSAPRMEGTVKPFANFSAEQDAQTLRKAMKGFGTDEKAIIDVLGYRTNAQRQEIIKMYKTCYGKDLIKDLKSELGGKFEDVVLAMMLKPDEFDADECRRAIAGLGTDEDTLIEILCSRSNAQIHAIRAAYKARHKKDLEKDLTGDTSGHFRRLMVSMCNGNRQEQETPSVEKAQREAKVLYDAGEGRWGTDESEFNRILCTQSHQQLALTFTEYTKLSKRTMEQVIRSEFSGNVETGLLAIVKVAHSAPAYFAEKLYQSMKGLGTNDRDLIRVVVTRSEVDMVQIKAEFQQRYKQSLEQFIKDDCSGDYKRMLLALVS